MDALEQGAIVVREAENLPTLEIRPPDRDRSPQTPTIRIPLREGDRIFYWNDDMEAQDRPKEPYILWYGKYAVVPADAEGTYLFDIRFKPAFHWRRNKTGDYELHAWPDHNVRYHVVDPS